MMLDRMEGNAELKTSVHQMLASRRLTHSVLLVGEEGLGAGFAARCIAADYLYPAGGAPAEALLRGECCRAVGKAGKRDSGQIETGIVREAISVEGMGAGGRYLVSQVTAMRSEIFNTSLSAEGRAVLLYHVERMNEESANALLKVMEEPPEGVLFLLTADSLAGVLPTIRSRCVSFAIAPVSPAACARYCTAHGVDKKTAALYSELFDGHIGTVLTAARDKARTEQVDKAMELARAAQAGDSYTAAVLLAMLIGKWSGLAVDGYVGLVVALFILFSAYKAAKETLSPLLGQAPDPELVQEIRDIVMAHDTVQGVHDLVVHDYGPGRCMISLHAEVPAHGDIMEMHDVIDNIEKELAEKLHCQAVIHMDPIVTDDASVGVLRRQIAEVVKQVDPRMTIHDFRMVQGTTHTNLIFDAVLPFSSGKTPEQAAEEIRQRVRQLNGTYFAVVTVEHSYTD